MEYFQTSSMTNPKEKKKVVYERSYAALLCME